MPRHVILSKDSIADLFIVSIENDVDFITHPGSFIAQSHIFHLIFEPILLLSCIIVLICAYLSCHVGVYSLFFN